MMTSRRNFVLKSMLATAGLSVSTETLGKIIPKIEDNSLPINSLQNNGAIKISVFSKALHFLNYEELASVVSEIGFDGVDLTVRPDGHVIPANVEQDLPRAIEILKKKGVGVYTITTSITDASDPLTERILKTASKVGIKRYRMGWLDYAQDKSIQENLTIFQDRLTKLAELNKKYNIYADYQNHSGTHLGGAIWDLYTVLSTIKTKWIGSQYDIRHATVEGAHSWPIGFKLLQPFIGSIDIKDFHWGKKDGKWEIENVPLGDGMVNFETFFELMKKFNLSAPISVHFEYSLGGAEEGARKISMPREEIFSYMKKDLQVLREWLKKAGI
jgi:L-ribulose-5-phosphate 3-epimerase